MWVDQRDELAGQLEGRQAILFADNQSALSRYWMTTLPRSQYLSLSGKEMGVGLCYRTLVPGHNLVCRECHQQNTLGHDECCAPRPRFYTYRHESLKNTLSYHLSMVDDTEVRVEWKQRDPVTNRPT